MPSARRSVGPDVTHVERWARSRIFRSRGSSSGAGASGIGSWYSSPWSAPWNDTVARRARRPFWIEVTCRVANVRPSRSDSTSSSMGPGRQRAEKVGVHRVWPPVVVDGLHRGVKRLGDDHAAEDAVAEPFGCDRVEATARVPRCGDRVDEVLHRAFDAAEPTCRTSPGSTFRRCASSSKASTLRPVSRSMPSSRRRRAALVGRERDGRTARRRSRSRAAGGCMRMDRCACCGTATSRGRRAVAAPSASTRISRATTNLPRAVRAAYHADPGPSAPGELRSELVTALADSSDAYCLGFDGGDRHDGTFRVTGRCDRRGSISRRRRARTG